MINTYSHRSLGNSHERFIYKTILFLYIIDIVSHQFMISLISPYGVSLSLAIVAIELSVQFLINIDRLPMLIVVHITNEIVYNFHVRSFIFHLNSMRQFDVFVVGKWLLIKNLIGSVEQVQR